MIDRSKLPTMRSRPPRRRRHHSMGQEPSVATPKVLAALAALVLGILWTVGVLFFSLTVVTVPDGSIGRRGQERQSLDKIPNINLWPDDEANRILNEHLADCLPQKCTLKSSSLSLPQKQQKQQPILITILRPPGVFGSVLERFTREFVQNSKFDKNGGTGRSVVVQAKSQSPPDAAAAAAAALTDETTDSTTVRKMKQQHPPQEYFVHCVTVPLLLQAADLALLTVSDSEGFPQERITWNDLLDVIVLLVRWHCRISTHVSRTKSHYVLKLGLAPTLSHPTKSEYDLAHLLDINLNDYASGSAGGHPSWMVDRGELSVLVLKRVDQATALLRQMQGFLPGDSTQDLQLAVDSLLQEEFRSSGNVGDGDDQQQQQYYCPTKPLRSGGIAGLGLFRWHSRMIDIVDLLLDDNTEMVCQTYPTIAYCREHKDPQQFDR
jgi:hypothetical protein